MQNENQKKLLQVLRVVLELDENMPAEDISVDNCAQWDSLNHMNLIVAIEDEFNITISEQDMNDMKSYKLIDEILKSYIK